MSKSWSKSYSSILKEHLDSWMKTHDQDGESKVVNLVFEAIQNQYDENDLEEGLPSDLDKVCPG